MTEQIAELEKQQSCRISSPAILLRRFVVLHYLLFIYLLLFIMKFVLKVQYKK